MSGADEVDSILSARGQTLADEASTRLKTQFMAELDGMLSSKERVIVVAATNRPQDLDASRERVSGQDVAVVFTKAVKVSTRTMGMSRHYFTV